MNLTWWKRVLRRLRETRVAGGGAVATAAVVALSLTGCNTHYQLQSEGMEVVGIASDKAPAWVNGGGLPHDTDRLFFVGRSLGMNVLHERAAYDAARDHAVEQLARQIGTRVRIVTDSSDVQRGVRYLPDGYSSDADDTDPDDNPGTPRPRSQHMSNVVRMASDAIAGRLVDQDVHWERWMVVENPERPFDWADRVLNRWKCWVLCSISRADFDELVAQTNEVLAEERIYPNKAMRVVGR